MAEQMNSEELQVAAFEIILHSGNARTVIHDAFASMRKKEDESEGTIGGSQRAAFEGA